MPHSRLSRRTVLRAGSLAFAASVFSQAAFSQTAAPLKIGIIGAGHIGSTLGTPRSSPATLGDVLSSRHPEELAPLVQELGPLAKNGAVADAIAFGDVVFIAVPYGAYPGRSARTTQPAFRQDGARRRQCAGPNGGTKISPLGEVNEEGIGITSAKYLPGARIVRAFNSMGYKFFVSESNRAGERMAIPLAGDDKDALATASTLVAMTPVSMPWSSGAGRGPRTSQQGGLSASN